MMRIDEFEVVANNFDHMVEDVVGFVTHFLGFKPEDVKGGECNNDFIWETGRTRLQIVFALGSSREKDKNDFSYRYEIDGHNVDGSFCFMHRLTHADEESIAEILQPFKDTFSGNNRVKYTCENCGDVIPYGSERAVSDIDDNDFCSQQCFNEYHGFRSIDWKSRSEYYKYTSKEWQLIVEELEKKSDQEKSKKLSEEEAKEIYEEIINGIKDVCDIDIDK